MRVREYTRVWLDLVPREKRSTETVYQGAVDRFAREHGQQDLAAVGVRAAREWGRRHPHDVASLRAMFSDALQEDLVATNPFLTIGVSRGAGRRRLKVPTEEEVLRLATVAEQFENGPTMAALITFAAHTAMRPSEIFGLDCCDVDVSAGRVSVTKQYYRRRLQPPKNGLTRELPFLPPLAAEAAKGVLSRAPKRQPLFTGKEGGRISQQMLAEYWHPVRRAFEEGLGVERRLELRESRPAANQNMVFAELRHAGATWLVERGVEAWVVAQMLGHTDGGRLVETRYGHPREKVARERLQEAFSGE